MQNRTKLKELMEGKELIRLVGAHNGLTAKLVEKHGFEGVWASGFEIAASHVSPDANILTMTDSLTACVDMADSISIPIVADCDTGFGNSNNVIRMVKKYEAAGIAAVCIEDKMFPKVNSYIPGRQEMAPIPEFVGKIMAGKSAQKTRDFMIFARVEALIAGGGMEEALKRARAYADAGADAILIHSKQKTPDEIIQFVKSWNNYRPLIIVPTTYSSLTEEEMQKLGIKMVIYANQGLRAAVKNMDEILSHINKYGIADIENKIAPMAEIFELQGMPQLKEDEKKYLRTEKGNIKVIIPAAGDVSSEESFKDKDLLKDMPVGMLDICGKPVLQRTVENLNSVGIQDIAVITGYQGNKIFDGGIKKIENPNFKQSSVMDSIMAAGDYLTGDKNLIIYSDILFEKDIVEKLLKSIGDIVLVIDSSYGEYKFPKKDLDLVRAKYPPIRGERVINVRNGNQILEIGKNIPRERANFEFIGIAMLSRKGVDVLKKEYKALLDASPLRDSSGNPEIGFIDLIQEIIKKYPEYPVEAIEVNGGWTEIKNFDDYRRACNFFSA